MAEEEVDWSVDDAEDQWRGSASLAMGVDEDVMDLGDDEEGEFDSRPTQNLHAQAVQRPSRPQRGHARPRRRLATGPGPGTRRTRPNRPDGRRLDRASLCDGPRDQGGPMRRQSPRSLREENGLLQFRPKFCARKARRIFRRRRQTRLRQRRDQGRQSNRRVLLWTLLVRHAEST